MTMVMAAADKSAPQPPRMLMSKRVGPPVVAPVTLDGVRYEALHWGRERGLGQNGGHLLAIDVASGRELWMACVYVIDHRQGLETDVQDVFIRSIDIAAAGRELLVVDERGRRFGFDIARRVAWAIDRTVAGASRQPPTVTPSILEHARRRAPRRVEPVEGNGVRYEILHGALSRGFGQNGGVIAAFDVASGRELWTLRVYAVPHDPAEEFDAQEVFITEMVIDAAANVLLLKNENRRSFRIDLADRSVAEHA